MSFFGFNTALPERRPADGGGQHSAFGGFAASGGNNDTTAFSMGGAGEEEDLAVYNWGDQMGSLMEDGDGMNDETFGDVGEIREYTGSSQGRAAVGRTWLNEQVTISSFLPNLPLPLNPSLQLLAAL